jgi:hypothetical protein
MTILKSVTRCTVLRSAQKCVCTLSATPDSKTRNKEKSQDNTLQFETKTDF